MTTISEYLKSIRLAKGHDTPAKMSKYAKTQGYSITAQAIRNFENNNKIPNMESREILSNVLHLNEEGKKRIGILCAHADIARKWGHLGLFIVDDLTRAAIARELTRVVLLSTETVGYTNSRDEFIKAAKRVEECLTVPIAGTRKTQT